MINPLLGGEVGTIEERKIDLEAAVILREDLIKEEKEIHHVML